MTKIINFYGHARNLDYWFFSNFSHHPIQLDGYEWMTSEHYFQAQKWAGTNHQNKVEEIRNAHDPSQAKFQGQDRSTPIRKDWEEVKDEVMRKAVIAKFTQHPDLRKELLATGDAIIVEHVETDKYWGDGVNGDGKNMLGIILMEVRERFKAQDYLESLRSAA